MSLNEADTRAQLIDPALAVCGWTPAHLKREETVGAIEILAGEARRRSKGRTDYTLRLPIVVGGQPVAIAVVEAKASHLAPSTGIDQAKSYARRLNVPFIFSSNGHQFVEYDNLTGLTAVARPIAEFPTPTTLRARYEASMGFSLEAPAAKPLVTPYAHGEGNRRYYQDAAIRAVFERLAMGHKRSLLSLATGAGKTFIAVNLLKRIADAGQLVRALFVCDRDELRSQAHGVFQNEFGSDAAIVSTQKPEKNARVLIASYQTLGIDDKDEGESFLVRHYPENYFSHIIIDECHRSAWGKWSAVLTRNPNAVQIGLTATPRQAPGHSEGVPSNIDPVISNNNYDYFGAPAYEYDLAQGIEDGWLAACEIVRRDIVLGEKDDIEIVTGFAKADATDKDITDLVTGEVLGVQDVEKDYAAAQFEQKLVLPDRIAAMGADLPRDNYTSHRATIRNPFLA